MRQPRLELYRLAPIVNTGIDDNNVFIVGFG
jgi:hypothetical protein